MVCSRSGNTNAADETMKQEINNNSSRINRIAQTHVVCAQLQQDVHSGLVFKERLEPNDGGVAHVPVDLDLRQQLLLCALLDQAGLQHHLSRENLVLAQ
jgi:hypothetical protein